MNTLIYALMGLILGYVVGIVIATVVAFVLDLEGAGRFIAIGSGLLGALAGPVVAKRLGESSPQWTVQPRSAYPGVMRTAVPRDRGRAGCRFGREPPDATVSPYSDGRCDTDRRQTVRMGPGPGVPGHRSHALQPTGGSS